MELSEEEKKAIEELEEFIEDDEIQNISVFSAKKIKNVIEKQQKEIEEKNRDIKKLNDLLMLSELDYISKDKIREKLNQIHNEFSNILLDKTLCLEEQNLNAHRYDAIRNVLEELLEEN